MMLLIMPLLESVLGAALDVPEFRAWLTATYGPGAVQELERIREHVDKECRERGW